MSELTVSFPRDLSDDERARISGAAQGAFDAIEWERAQPVHVCVEADHGRLAYRHAAICLRGCSLGGLTGPTPEAATDAMRAAIVEHGRTSAGHEIVPASDAEGPFWADIPSCHDCGRGLVRPPVGDGAADSWVCPLVHRHPAALGLSGGAVLECGSPR